MLNLTPIDHSLILRNGFYRSSPVSIIYPRRSMGDIDNMAHYNGSNDADYLPPLIADESENSYELPSIRDNETEENRSDVDFSVRHYEESGGPIAYVMRNWVNAMTRIFNSSENTSANARCVVTDPSGKPVKLRLLEGLKPAGIDGACNDGENYELPSLVVDDDIC